MLKTNIGTYRIIRIISKPEEQSIFTVQSNNQLTFLCKKIALYLYSNNESKDDEFGEK